MLNEGPAVEPRASAAVLVLEGRRPWKLLLMRRPGGAEFAPDAYVYPGGGLHEEDAAFGDPIRAAAARELFEEVGLLLARGPRGFARDPDCERMRGLLAGGLSFARALGEADLHLAPDRLVYLTRWITPSQLRRRYDARFFVARRPAAQTVCAHPGEVVDWLWLEPQAALADGQVNLVHATRRILESVAAEPDAARLIARLRRRRVTAPPIQPELELTGGGWRVVEPAPPGHRQRPRQRS